MVIQDSAGVTRAYPKAPAGPDVRRRQGLGIYSLGLRDNHTRPFSVFGTATVVQMSMSARPGRDREGVSDALTAR